MLRRCFSSAGSRSGALLVGSGACCESSRMELAAISTSSKPRGARRDFKTVKTDSTSLVCNGPACSAAPQGPYSRRDVCPAEYSIVSEKSLRKGQGVLQRRRTSSTRVLENGQGIGRVAAGAFGGVHGFVSGRAQGINIAAIVGVHCHADADAGPDKLP